MKRMLLIRSKLSLILKMVKLFFGFSSIPGDKYAMDLKSGNLLTPPSIKNVSCNHERYSQPIYYYIGPLDFIQSLIIFLMTIGIIGANLMLIFVINHRRYSPYIDPQVISIFLFSE